MLVKICGIQDIETAQATVDAGADFLGFIFVPGSKKFIEANDAKVIIDAISGRVKTVGVFQDQPIDEVNRVADMLGLDYVQLHGVATSDDVVKINTKVIKAFNLPSDFDVDEMKTQMSQYRVEFFLLDREIQGEGRHLNMQKVFNLTKEFPIFVSGGLNAGIIEAVIKTTRPAGVDVSSGVETSGKKDVEKIKKFITIAKGGKVNA